jgi:hypothetical protein
VYFSIWIYFSGFLLSYYKQFYAYNKTSIETIDKC